MTATDTTPASGTADQASPSDRRRWVVAAATVTVAVTLVRWLVSRGRDEYSIWPDEPAQLAIARYVGGGTRWYMHNHSIWRPMFGTLLSPVHWFTDDATTVFHAALALNAALGGLAAALIALLTARLTGLGPWLSVAVAAVVSLSPALLFTTDFVYSESLLLALYPAVLLALVRLHERPGAAIGVSAAVLAGLAFGTHSRMLPLTFVVVGVAVVAGARRRLAWPSVAVVVVTAAAVTLAVQRYTDLLVDRLWNEPSTRNSPEGVVAQLGDIPAILVSLAGQTWTILVASVGIAAYGAVTLTARALRRLPASSDGGRPTVGDARVVVVAVAACVALSVVFMSDRWRSDQAVYGRYNAIAVIPLLVVGIAVLAGHVRLRPLPTTVVATAATTIAAAAVVWWSRGDLLRADNGLEPMILGLQPYITSTSRIDVPRITLWAVVAMLALGAVAVAVRSVSHRTSAVLALLALVVTFGSVRTRDTIDRTWNPSRSTRTVEVLAERELADRTPVDYLLAPGSNATIPMMLYQFHLSETPFAVVDDPLAGRPGSYVFAPDDDPTLRAAGARIVWRDPHRPLALWRR